MVDGCSEEIGQPHYIHFSELADLIILYLPHAFDELVSLCGLRSHNMLCHYCSMDKDYFSIFFFFNLLHISKECV